MLCVWWAISSLHNALQNCQTTINSCRHGPYPEKSENMTDSTRFEPWDMLRTYAEAGEQQELEAFVEAIGPERPFVLCCD